MKKVALFILFLCIFYPLISKAATNTVELNSAISWMNQKWLTQYKNSSDFKTNKNIQRNEAAKFFSQFAKNIKLESATWTSTYCKKLKDVPNNSLSGYIMDVCTRGVIQWSNGKFNPTATLSNQQAVAIIIRMIEWKKEESGKRWSDVYYQRAKELWLLDNISLDNRSDSITRWNLGILLYRAWQLLNKSTLNQGTLNQGTWSTYLESYSTSCSGFADKLSSCEKYTCEFIHPIIPQNMKREIVGIVWWKCAYIEEMPNWGQMQCKYTEVQRKIAAKYYNYISNLNGNTFTTKVTGFLGSWVEATSTVDGEEIENPLQTYLNDWTCTISGYE